MHSVVVHYKELALKGRNRPWFIQKLVRNLRVALEDLDVREVRPLMGRIDIELALDSSLDAAATTATWERIRDRVRYVFGIANFSHAGRAPHDFAALTSAILADLGNTQ